MVVNKNRALLDVEIEHSSGSYSYDWRVRVCPTGQTHGAESTTGDLRGVRVRMTTRVRLGGGVGALALFLMMAVGNAASVPSGMGGTGLAGAPAGLVAAISRSEQREAAYDPAYRLDAQGCTRLSAQYMTACFTPGGARFRTPHAALHLSLTAWGRPGRLIALALATGRPHGNRVEFRGSGIRAWWRVLPLGYEQGFTVERAPAGHGPVVIVLRASRIPAVRGDRLAWGTLRYGKLRVTDAVGRVLPATLTAAGCRVILRFDAAHARYPLNVDPLVWVEQEVTADDGAAGDQFGHSVAVSGATALVGAPLHAVGGNVRQGAAYVYTETNGNWSQAAELTASDGAADNEFGYSVALYGSTALVGAPGKVSNAREGAAYVYTETNGNWSQTAELTASDGAASDVFGTSVALSGSTALVGAPVHAVGGNAGQGAAYVYIDTSSTWSQTAELTASDGAANDWFGYSVAVSGPTALVGARDHAVGGNAYQGAAYVYTDTHGSWGQTAELTASDGAQNDRFGTSTALSGATALVGAPFHQPAGLMWAQGAAYVYTEASGTWSQAAELTASDGLASNLLGSSVALDGATAVVGADNVGTYVLPAYVYVEPAGGWATTSSFSAELRASDEGGSDRFGGSVALSGSTVLVGAIDHPVGGNTNQGAAYFFGSADLGLVLSAPATVAPGSNYTSQAIFTNNSASASPALSVSLPVPTGTNYVSSSATQGGCSQTAGTVTCNLGSLAASGGRANASVTLQATAATGTALANSANLSSSTPVLSQTSTTTVAVAPAVTGLANVSATIGQSVPAANFTIAGTGALTVSASSSNTTLLPTAGLAMASGCNANGAHCTLTLTPAAGQTGTATVTVTVMDVYGGQGSGSFTLTVSGLPPPPPSHSGGGGALDRWSLLGLLLAFLLPTRQRLRPGSNPAPGS